MTLKVILRQKARSDLLDVFDYINARNPTAAARWLAAAHRTIHSVIAEHPHIGVGRDYNRPSLAGVRALAVRGFKNYLIYYRVDRDTIRIIRVLHGARDVPNVLE